MSKNKYFSDTGTKEELTIKTLFQPVIRLQLLRLFFHEPEMEFDLSELALQLNRLPRTLQRHLAFFLQHDIIHECYDRTTMLYCLNHRCLHVEAIRRVFEVWRY